MQSAVNSPCCQPVIKQTNTKMAECAYTEDGKYFSVISQDGRLRIWDTETNTLKQEYTPDLHLSSPLTCLHWITLKNTAESKNPSKRKLSGSDTEYYYLALGMKNGKILLYSVAQAKVESILEEMQNNDIQNCNIASLEWHKKYGLFSCNKENYVHEWSIQENCVRYKYNVNVEKKKQGCCVSAIKIVPHNQKSQAKFLVTASRQLRLWCLYNGSSTLLRNMGHSNATRSILTLASVQDKCIIIEGSDSERLLAFWDVTITPDNLPNEQVNGENSTPKKQRKKSLSEAETMTTPLYNFTLEDSPCNLDVNIMNVDGGTKLNLAASTRSGVVHYFGHMLNGASTKPIKPSVTIKVATKDGKVMPLNSCKFTTEQDSGEMLIGYEATSVRLMFERVIPDTRIKSQVLVRADPSLEATKKKKRKEDAKKENSDVTVEPKVTYLEPAGGVVRKRATPGASVEVPVEMRLANLELDTKSRGQSAVNQNLTKLLVQGLHSKDKTLILTVLQKDDPAVAERTVSGLPGEYIPKLLEQLTDLATRKTSQCSTVCTWLSALLRCHAAFLLATLHMPSTGEQLAKILAVLTQRRSHLCQLLNLRGRLELVTAQRLAPLQYEDQPILNYEDSSSSEEDMEQAQSEPESWSENFESDDQPSDEVM